MAADALAPSVARSSAAMVLITYDTYDRSLPATGEVFNNLYHLKPCEIL